MDPQACYERMIREIRIYGNGDEALDAFEDLRAWIRGGGFEPEAFEDRTVRSAFFRGFEAMRSVALAMNL